MHNSIKPIYILAWTFLAILTMGCGQTEYTGLVKEKYEACQHSKGIEYHPEGDECYCPNGIVCMNSNVCDTDMDACMRYKRNSDDNECDGDLIYKFESNLNNLVLVGTCSTNPDPVTESVPIAPPSECDQSEEDCTPEDNKKGNGNADGSISGDDAPNTTEPSTCKETNSSCEARTLSWCSYNKRQQYDCPKGCTDNKCNEINSQALETITCNEENQNEFICVTDDNKSQQYQCNGSEWVSSKACDGACDIAQHLCECDPNNFQDRTGHRVCYELQEGEIKHHIVITL